MITNLTLYPFVIFRISF